MAELKQEKEFKPGGATRYIINGFLERRHAVLSVGDGREI
jgi:hypothetical protein